jgi:hypothetical protein
MGGLEVVCLTGDRVIPASPGEKGGYYFWEDLKDNQRPGALTVAIDWEGFTESQMQDVIRRVLDGEEPDFWMDGVEPEVERPVRPLTLELIDCCQLDVWPGMATITDFGLKTSSHLGALQFAIREGLVMPHELDAAMGNGDKLTKIAQRGDNPYRNVEFRTAWDDMGPEPEEFLAPEETIAIAAEIRADEHAARVRDFGEADASTYEARMAEPYRLQAEALGPKPPISAPVTEAELSAIERSWTTPQDKFKAILSGERSTIEPPSREPERDHER